MRFALKITVATTMCAGIIAGTAQSQSFTRAETDAAKQRSPLDVRRRAAGTTERPIVPQGLYAERAASSLGHISAMLSAEDGSIFALSLESGQLYHLTDRGFDGCEPAKYTSWRDAALVGL